MRRFASIYMTLSMIVVALAGAVLSAPTASADDEIVCNTDRENLILICIRGGDDAPEDVTVPTPVETGDAEFCIALSVCVPVPEIAFEPRVVTVPLTTAQVYIGVNEDELCDIHCPPGVGNPLELVPPILMPGGENSNNAVGVADVDEDGEFDGIVYNVQGQHIYVPLSFWSQE
jgi:hypothetical protein